MKDKELKLEEVEAYHTLGGAGEGGVQGRGRSHHPQLLLRLESQASTLENLHAISVAVPVSLYVAFSLSLSLTLSLSVSVNKCV
jgi:hypothetical protein